MNIEVLDSLTKILPSYKVVTDKPPIIFSAAKNEVISFQVALSSSNKNEVINNVGIDFPYGKVVIYVEGFINITKQSTIEGLLGVQPDILVPDIDEYYGEKRNAFPLKLEGRTRALWVDVYVTHSFSGRYLLKLNINEQIVSLTIDLLNFSIPTRPSLRTAFPVGYQEVVQGHGMTIKNISTIMPLYTKALAKNRLCNDELLVFAPVMDDTGKVDFTELTKVVNENKSILTTFRIKDWGFRPTQIEYSKAVSYYKQYKAKLIELGIYDISFHYTMDEPKKREQWEEIKLMSKCLHEAGIFKVSVTTSIQNAILNGITNEIDLYIPTIRHMDNKPTGIQIGDLEPPGGADTIGNQRAKYGDMLYWYQACGSHGCNIVGGNKIDDPLKYHTGWPSYMIDLPFIYSRIMEWMTYKYNIQGELYYETVFAYGQVNSPWNTVNYFGGNGDGTLFYPGNPNTIGGTTHIPIESIRLKQIRNGLQDYEYFVLGTKLGLGRLVNDTINSIVRSTYDFEKDANKFTVAKLILADTIDIASDVVVEPPKDVVKIDGTITINGKKYKINQTLEESV